MPRLLMFACVVELIGSLLETAATGEWCVAVFQAGFLIPIVSGRPWARMLALVGAVLGVLLPSARLILGWGNLTPAELIAMPVWFASNALWIFALQQRQAIRYFDRK